MNAKRLVNSFFLFAVMALVVNSAFAGHKSGQASGSWIAQASASTTDNGGGEIETEEPKGGKGEYRRGERSKGTGELETDKRGRKAVKKGAFTDSDGTGWNYCSGRCKKVSEKIPRAGGGKDNVIRITNINCKCSCVLFKDAGGKLVKKLEVTGKKGYLNIGQDNPKDYTKRCCEED